LVVGREPGDSGETLGVEKTFLARPHFRFGFAADKTINIGELSTENLGSEEGREVEDEDLEISSMEGHIQGISRQFISPFPSPKPSY